MHVKDRYEEIRVRSNDAHVLLAGKAIIALPPVVSSTPSWTSALECNFYEVAMIESKYLLALAGLVCSGSVS
jgi:hypothetical protein